MPALDKRILAAAAERKRLPVNLYELIQKFPNDDACRAHLEKVRWPNGVRCPRCGHDKITRLVKRKQFTCAKKSCRFRFSVTVDTILHASKLPLVKWFMAITMLADAKKSVSSLQLHRHLKISKECCWHLTMRIREAMAENTEQSEMFRGVVQCDEYYVGGRVRPEDRARGVAKKGRGSFRKRPIFGAFEARTGRVRTCVVPDIKTSTLAAALQRVADLKQTELHTDEYPAYSRIGMQCSGHSVVSHSLQYVTADGIHTNNIENVWSLLARSIMGSFHKISRKHLARYLAEFDARFNARHLNGQFFDRVVNQSIGRRLPMKELVRGALTR